VRDKLGSRGILELAGVERGAWDSLVDQSYLLVYCRENCGLFLYSVLLQKSKRCERGGFWLRGGCWQTQGWRCIGKLRAASAPGHAGLGGNAGCHSSLLRGVEVSLEQPEESSVSVGWPRVRPVGPSAPRAQVGGSAAGSEPLAAEGWESRFGAAARRCRRSLRRSGVLLPFRSRQ